MTDKQVEGVVEVELVWILKVGRNELASVVLAGRSDLNVQAVQ